MASPNLTTEVTAVPVFPVEEEPSFNASAIFFEDDVSQSFRSSTTKHREFVVSYKNQTNAMKASFESFFDARMGPYETFYFNIPRTGEVDIKVRFVESKVKYVADSPVTWAWTVTLKKVT